MLNSGPKMKEEFRKRTMYKNIQNRFKLESLADFNDETAPSLDEHRVKKGFNFTSKLVSKINSRRYFFTSLNLSQ